MNVDALRELFQNNFEGMNSAVIGMSKSAITKNFSRVIDHSTTYAQYRDALMEQVEMLINHIEGNQ